MGVHGTGLGLARTADEAAIPIIGILAMDDSCRFAIRIAKDALAICDQSDSGLVAQLDAVLPVVRREFWLAQLAAGLRVGEQFEELEAIPNVVEE